MVNRLKMSRQKNNLFWSKEKLEEIYFSKVRQNTLTNGHARDSGEGDGGIVPDSCCRLCGADQCLWGIQETCIWDGVDERFDRLLFNCFGVKVAPEDCKICEHCISHLMCAYKFKALVQAAFSKTTSGESSTLTSTEALVDIAPAETVDSHFVDQGFGEDTSDRVINKTIVPAKRTMKRNVIKNISPKKAIICCSVCGQRYPMMTQGDEKEFTCSRCKLKRNVKSDLKKCSVVLRKDVIKDESKGKNR